MAEASQMIENRICMRKSTAFHSTLVDEFGKPFIEEVPSCRFRMTKATLNKDEFANFYPKVKMLSLQRKNEILNIGRYES